MLTQFGITLGQSLWGPVDRVPTVEFGVSVLFEAHLRKRCGTRLGGGGGGGVVRGMCGSVYKCSYWQQLR